MIYDSLIYASLSLQDIDPNNKHFRLLTQLSLKPEISLESGWKNHTPAQFQRMAAIIQDFFPAAAVHLPYGELDFGRGDNFQAKKDLLLQALDLANLFAPRHLIGHPSYQSLTDSILGPQKFTGLKRDNLAGPRHIPAPKWLDRSLSVWGEILRNTEARLYLENTREHSPEPLMILLRQLGHRASFCLDFGHWFHYAMGLHWDNLGLWLTMTSSHLAHAHVHDNNGEGDQHLAVGQGRINYDQVRRLLLERDLRPSLTLENHNPIELKASYDILAKNPLWLEPEKPLDRKVS
ncbi:MAG: TIM barrel protein [Deltaproteobacteria bacterium]|jgi:sugar phosphate isomerase/epimerase|nr:TIM barrel protein [Deltaproteobacteria bacterium]